MKTIEERALDVLLEALTDPASGFSTEEAGSLYATLLSNGTIPRSFPLEGPLVKFGQDLRLSVDEIDALRDRFLTPYPKAS